MITYFSPAKINLFLHVLRKRADGYHDLQTVFQFLDYGDDLSYELRQDGLIKRQYDFGFDEISDLNTRAANLLRHTAERPDLGVNISLHKRLPMGGGLGGGSSNAATTLVALNELWNTGFTNKELQAMGFQLGADIPVFVYGHSAWAEGIGERLSPIQLPEPYYVVLYPEVNVSTAEIFSHNYLTPHPEMKKIRALRSDQIGTFGVNDLEPIVKRLAPSVATVIDWLSRFGNARMSGSGASVYLACETLETASEIFAQRPSDLNGFVARGLNRIPR